MKTFRIPDGKNTVIAYIDIMSFDVCNVEAHMVERKLNNIKKRGGKCQLIIIGIDIMGI